MNVSIIIPVYNVSSYVKECIQSVMDQTMTTGVECILVDDCGQDNSIEIAQEFISEYEGEITFRIIHHDHNRGLSAARNTGIKYASGEYIYLLDSDDWIYKDCLTNLYNLVLDHPGVDLVQGMMRYSDENENKWLLNPVKLHNVPEYTDNVEECRHRFQSEHYLSMAQNRLIRKSFITDNKLFFKEGLLHEDDHWMIFAGKHIESIAYCREITYFYRANPNGIIATSGNNLFASMCAIIDDILYDVTSLGRFFDEINYVLSHIVMYEAKGFAPLHTIKHKDNIFLKLLYELYPYRYGRRLRLLYSCIISLFWLQLKIANY